MKKIIISVLIFAFAAFSAGAYELKDAFYFGPYVGFKIFDDKTDLDDNPEVGLKLGYLITEHWAAELSAGYVNSEYTDDNDDQSVFTPGIHAVYLFRPSVDKSLLPFLQAGVEMRLADDTDTGLALGGGLKYLFTKNFGGDVSYKNVYFGEGKHDQLVALSVAYFFGVKEQAPMKVEPLPEPAAVEQKKEEAMVAVVDTDGDGVYDAQDQCPGTAQGVMVDETGCFIPVDTDGDGVYDHQDQCPGTMKGVSVDDIGCFRSVKLEVNFATSSDEIDAASMVKVEEFATFMKENPSLTVLIQGHADSRGSNAYNLALSEKRAKSVASAIAGYGVEAERIETKGYGETVPVETNDTLEGRHANRRIEAVALTDEGGRVKFQKPE